VLGESLKMKARRKEGLKVHMMIDAHSDTPAGFEGEISQSESIFYHCCIDTNPFN